MSESGADKRRREQAKLIDWPEAARGKFALLSRLYDHFAANDVSDQTALAAEFTSFVNEGGDRLREHALFEALHRKWFRAEPPVWSWTDWPAEWRNPGSDAVVRYAAAESRAAHVATPYERWSRRRRDCARRRRVAAVRAPPRWQGRRDRRTRTESRRGALLHR